MTGVKVDYMQNEPIDTLAQHQERSMCWNEKNFAKKNGGTKPLA